MVDSKSTDKLKITLNSLTDMFDAEKLKTATYFEIKWLRLDEDVAAPDVVLSFESESDEVDSLKIKIAVLEEDSRIHVERAYAAEAKLAGQRGEPTAWLVNSDGISSLFTAEEFTKRSFDSGELIPLYP